MIDWDRSGIARDKKPDDRVLMHLKPRTDFEKLIWERQANKQFVKEITALKNEIKELKELISVKPVKWREKYNVLSFEYEKLKSRHTSVLSENNRLIEKITELTK